MENHHQSSKIFSNYQLQLSALLLIIVALYYVTFPNENFLKIIEISNDDISIRNIFKSISFLYFGMAIWWLIGSIKPQFWWAATISNVILMLSLALGRTISLIVDGIPSIYFTIGTFIEFAMGFWGILNLKFYRK